MLLKLGGNRFLDIFEVRHQLDKAQAPQAHNAIYILSSKRV